MDMLESDTEMDVALCITPVSMTPESPTLDASPQSGSAEAGTGADGNGRVLRKRKKASRNRQRTIEGVTHEARIVLEQFLQSSLSKRSNDASPAKRGLILSGGGVTAAGIEPHAGVCLDEHTTVPYTGQNTVVQYGGGHSDHSSSGSQGMKPTTGRNMNMSGDDSLEGIMDGETHPEDDDYTSHSPVSNTTSVGSRSSSFHKKSHYIRPVHPEEMDTALETYTRGQSQRRRPTRENSTNSTASDQSEGSVDSRGRRKKKTLYKRAAERLRQSFRMLSERERTSDQQHLAASARKKGRPSSLHGKTAIVQSRVNGFDNSPMGSGGYSIRSSGRGKASRFRSKASKKKYLIKQPEKENKGLLENIMKTFQSKCKKQSKG